MSKAVGGAGTPPQSPGPAPPRCTPSLGAGDIRFPSRISLFAEAGGERTLGTTRLRTRGPDVYLTRGRCSNHRAPPPLPGAPRARRRQIGFPFAVAGQPGQPGPDRPPFQAHCPLEAEITPTQRPGAGGGSPRHICCSLSILAELSKTLRTTEPEP